MTLAKKLFCTSVALSALCAALPIKSHAESTAGTTRAQASIDFRIVIPALVRVRAVAQPTEITIEAAHLAQGYLDLDNASLLVLTSNNRQGYQLAARYDAKLLARIEVRIGGQSLSATDGQLSTRVQSPVLREASMAVGYRLYLNPGVVVGTYSWPVALMFSTLAV